MAKEPRRVKEPRRALGVVGDALGRSALHSRLRSMGPGGDTARRLDTTVEAMMTTITSLSSLSSPLALDYLERIRRPIAGLSLASGVFTTTRGYVAHLAVEADPAAFGAADIPVLGTLPGLRRGRPPRDVLTRVVKATRRGFEAIRAVDDDVWAGFVLATVWRVHAHDGDDEALEAEPDGHLDPAVIDGLVRFGWVLRQADIHYGLAPERA